MHIFYLCSTHQPTDGICVHIVFACQFLKDMIYSINVTMLSVCQLFHLNLQHTVISKHTCFFVLLLVILRYFFHIMSMLSVSC
eukprot:m.372224 g.372224  ORF g.372224 m.372224 type:complete len:83 (-) comp62488_c0_seq1:34-282(-)